VYYLAWPRAAERGREGRHHDAAQPHIAAAGDGATLHIVGSKIAVKKLGGGRKENRIPTQWLTEIPGPGRSAAGEGRGRGDGEEDVRHSIVAAEGGGAVDGGG
jgi:hypothetical protein